MHWLKAPVRIKKRNKKTCDHIRHVAQQNKEAGERMEAAGELPPPPKAIRRTPAAPDPTENTASQRGDPE